MRGRQLVALASGKPMQTEPESSTHHAGPPGEPAAAVEGLPVGDLVRGADGCRAGATRLFRAEGAGGHSRSRSTRWTVRVASGGGSCERSSRPNSGHPSGAGAGADAWWHQRSPCVSGRERHVSLSRAPEIRSPGGDCRSCKRRRSSLLKR